MILDSFSEDDGSRDKIAAEMAEFDKFGRYAETKYKSVSEDALVWGDYWIRKVVYQFRGQEISLPELMLCHGEVCKMTTLTENVDADSELLNLFLQRVNDYANQRQSCSPKTMKVYPILLYPELSQKDQNPISLLLPREQLSVFKDGEFNRSFQ